MGRSIEKRGPSFPSLNHALPPQPRPSEQKMKKGKGLRCAVVDRPGPADCHDAFVKSKGDVVHSEWSTESDIVLLRRFVSSSVVKELGK